MTFSLKFIRKKHYKRQRKHLKEYFDFDIDDWFKNPYSCLKARLYMEAASILVFIVRIEVIFFCIALSMIFEKFIFKISKFK